MIPSDVEDETPNGPADEALEAARTLLRRLIQAQGFTLGEIDAKLNYARGYVSRLIHGQARLTYKHILAIMNSIEVDPGLFFSTLHPYPSHASREVEAGLRELRAIIDRLTPVKDSAPEAPPGSSGLNREERIDSAVRTVRRNRISAKA